jgi:hypothetical protein
MPRRLLAGAVRAGLFSVALVRPGSASLAAQEPAAVPDSARSHCPHVTIPRPARPVRSPCGVRCGSERWRVKTLSDTDARRVQLIPVDATVESLAALPRPNYLHADGRAAPTETTIFCVEGWLLDFATEADYDLHLIVGGLADTSSTIIAELPDARCSGACASGFAELYAHARAALEERLKRWTTDTLRVRIMGVGFFDRPHGQYGAAPNYIELHPVLAIDFP